MGNCLETEFIIPPPSPVSKMTSIEKKAEVEPIIKLVLNYGWNLRCTFDINVNGIHITQGSRNNIKEEKRNSWSKFTLIEIMKLIPLYFYVD